MFDDPRVATVTHRHGALGAHAWIFALATAKRQNRAGRIEFAPIILARNVGVPIDEAAATIAALAEVGLLAHVEGDVYDVPRWVDKQPDEESRAAQAARKRLHPGRKPGRPRKSDVIPQNPTKQRDHDQDQDHDKEQEPMTTSLSAVADADSVAECDHLASWIERNGSKRPNVTKAWLQAADRLKRIDGRTHEQVMEAIDWCQQDEFWSGNVLSMPKLRSQYDRLRLAARRARSGSAVDSEVRQAQILAALQPDPKRPKEIGDGTNSVG